MTHYLRVETAAAGVHLHPLPDDLTDEQLAGRITALQARYDIPPDWSDHPDRGSPAMRLPGGGMTEPVGQGWDVAVLEGPLHPSLLEAATLHHAEEGP